MLNRRVLLQSLLSVAALVLPGIVFAESAGSPPEPQKIERVLSAGRVADVLLMSLAPEKLAGISMEILPQRMKMYFLPRIQQIPNVGRLTGRGSTASLEKIVAIKPDIIIDVGNVSKTYTETAERVKQQTGIPYVLIDGRFENTAEQIRQIAALIGVRQRGKVLANLAENIMMKTRKTVSKQTALRVYFGRGADGLETGLAGSIHAEVLDWVGAQNVAAAAGQKIIARVSIEQILQWDPEVIITHDENFYAALQQSATVWQTVSAVRNQRIYLIPSEPFGWLDQPPGINRLLGSIWLTHILAPERLSAKDTARLITDYFRLFYQYDLSPRQLAAFGIRYE